MTHIHRYKLPIRHRHPNALRHLAWTVAIMLAVYGLWWSVTSARAGYMVYTQHEALVEAANERADNAMADVILAMKMLAGTHHVATEDRIEVARVEWYEMKLVEGLK